jgi:hypothetical protein
VLTDDVPFSFSPVGICNRPTGTAGRPANEPGHVQAWRWEDIADVREVGGQLVINGKNFCAATGHLRAEKLYDLAVACTSLPTDARAKLLRAWLRLWLRPAHLRRRAAVLRSRTSLLVGGNLLVLVGAVVLTAAFLGRLPEQVVITQTSLGIGLLLLHAILIGLAWWKRGHLLRLVHRDMAVNNPLMGALFFPPSALRLRALLGAEWFPVSHPVAVALAYAPHTARDELIFNAFADLRWPLVSPGDGGGPLVSEVLTWFRAALERERRWLCVLVLGTSPTLQAGDGDATRVSISLPLAQLAEASGARLEALGAKGHILMWDGVDGPAEIASRAARVALSLRRAFAGVPMGLASGRADTGGSVPVGEALERYSADRRAHLDFYQLATRWLTPFFQSDLTPLAWVRDALMRRAGWLRYAEREMVRSMCGTKTGIFSGSMRTEMPAKAPVEAPTSLT